MTISKTIKTKTIKSNYYPQGVKINLDICYDKYNDKSGFAYLSSVKYYIIHSFDGINGYIDTTVYSKSGAYKAFKRIIAEYAE